MNQPISKYALIAERLYVCTRTIDPITPEGTITPRSLGRIVLCRPEGTTAETAEEFYLPEAQWRRAAENFAANAKESGTVTSQSPACDKIALYRSLFKGRVDVHAHGFRGKDGRIGYAPACANEWKRGICPRTQERKVKCAACESKAFAPLSDAVLIAHLGLR